MDYFYVRKESGNKVEIEIKTGAFYLLVALIVGWMGLNVISGSAETGASVLPIILVFMVFRFFALWKVQKEVLVAMKQKQLETRGSKFSFANPLTYVITRSEE
ncbi:hypothetical protein [Veronia nyctiphanis]|uniref:hypothetical protein n=1 Tax=Veronia nyctiphanis TaxID=1278244 RepID=UPI001F2AD43F|nr:hypothetical protein [Veronia nyctiphanis]